MVEIRSKSFHSCGTLFRFARAHLPLKMGLNWEGKQGMWRGGRGGGKLHEETARGCLSTPAIHED